MTTTRESTFGATLRTTILLASLSGLFVLIGFLTFFAFWVAAIAFGIMGAIKANNGEEYRYPIAIRMVK